MKRLILFLFIFVGFFASGQSLRCDVLSLTCSGGLLEVQYSTSTGSPTQSEFINPCEITTITDLSEQYEREPIRIYTSSGGVYTLYGETAGLTAEDMIAAITECGGDCLGAGIQPPPKDTVAICNFAELDSLMDLNKDSIIICPSPYLDSLFIVKDSVIICPSPYMDSILTLKDSVFICNLDTVPDYDNEVIYPICFITDAGDTVRTGALEVNWVDTTVVSSIYYDLTTGAPYFNVNVIDCYIAPIYDTTLTTVPICAVLADATQCNAYLAISQSVGYSDTTIIGENGYVIEPVNYTIGACSENKAFFSTCFLPDQYAYIWAWNGAGDIQRYDPLTSTWTDYGRAPNGGFALAFRNDVTQPTVFYQSAGTLYSSDPNDPLGTFQTVGSTAPANSSYPCFDFDPSGRLLLGDGTNVWEVDPTTANTVFLGQLIDARDGATLNAGPGDWFFDPNGNWFMMATDPRGTSFGETCNGTVLWQIDPVSLEATRLSNSCSPVNGTGATWLAAGRSLLSTSGGTHYEYNQYTDTWSVFTNAIDGVNDLASQWVVPDPIYLCGWKNLDCKDPDTCRTDLYQITNDASGAVVCQLYTSTITGKFGVCEKESNPFVTDPAQEDEEFLSDQDWHEGCSDAGFTYWRVSYDPSNNAVYEYVYQGLDLTNPTQTQPPGFFPIPCDEIRVSGQTLTPFCDVDRDTTIYLKQVVNNDGSVDSTWFDVTGEISQPTNIVAEACDISDPELSITEEIICLNDSGYVRRTEQIYVLTPEGQLELQSTVVSYYNESGTLWSSDVSTSTEPQDWYLGNCTNPYIEIKNERLCEFDSEKLLLIDSGGEFAEYDLNTGTYEIIPTLSVPSAGSGADPDNFILYAITSGQTLQTVDVNTKMTISDVPLFTNDGSPLSFSAAHFYNGILYGYDTGTNSLYAINVNTAEVSFVAGPYTNDGNSGTSLAINPVDGKFYFVSNGGVFRELDPTGASLAMTIAYDADNNLSNGATFDTDGNAYITQAANTVCIENFGTGNEVERVIVDDFTAGANSITYYKTIAQKPSCFHRRYGIDAEGNITQLGDFFIGTNTPRVISGFVDCCDAQGGGVSGPIEIVEDRYTTTFDSEFFNSAFSVPTVPANTKEMVVFNNSGAWIEVTTNKGTELVPPRGTAEWSVYDYETGITITSVSLVGGTFGPNDTWGINYRITQ